VSSYYRLTTIEKDNIFKYIIYCGGVSAFLRYYEFNIKRPTPEKFNIYKEILSPVKCLIDSGESTLNISNE